MKMKIKKKHEYVGGIPARRNWTCLSEEQRGVRKGPLRRLDSRHRSTVAAGNIRAKMKQVNAVMSCFGELTHFKFNSYKLIIKGFLRFAIKCCKNEIISFAVSV
jgi:hypothetical protein